MLTDEKCCKLVDAARAAITKAFRTSPGGTAYGAAVLTSTGQIYTSGQYSSFNHITNVHAEHAAILLATMADDPLVVALAVASNGPDSVTRPCGICRQVIAEHAARTGGDIEVLMAHRHDDGYERAALGELLPHSWAPASRAKEDRSAKPLLRKCLLQAARTLEAAPARTGDHLVLPDDCQAMVWDERFAKDGNLVKIKYAPAREATWRKLPSSFKDALHYQCELANLGWNRTTDLGARACVVAKDEIRGIRPALPLNEVEGEPPPVILEAMVAAGINLQAVRVTGSRALDLQTAQSDWDLVVPVDEDGLHGFRERLFTELTEERISLPPGSGTWQLLDRIFPGGQRAVLEDRRFIDTAQADGVSVALMFVPKTSPETLLEEGWTAAGRGLCHGRVTDHAKGGYKRSKYWLESDEHGLVEVTSYHKASNLLRSGDLVSIRGWWLRRGEERRLVQLLREPDSLTWLETGHP